MKSVLISIQPQWCELIASGKKTIEVRKSAPKEVPFKAYIYETKAGFVEAVRGTCPRCAFSRGKVIGEFVCDKVYDLFPWGIGVCVTDERGELVIPDVIRNNSCLTDDEICEYLNNRAGKAWHITDLKIYDKPKELSEFYTLGNCEKYDFCNQCKNFHRGQGWLDGSYCDEDSCLDNTRIPVTRAPKSWQYVEELQ